jgi:ankyrin repeat protein
MKGPVSIDESLLRACSDGQDSLVRQLLERGVDVNHGDKDRFTALHFACEGGHEGVAKVLLEHGAKVDQADGGGKTALHCACIHGHESTAKLLLDHGAKVDQRTLSLCKDLNHPNIVKLLHKVDEAKAMRMRMGEMLLKACIDGQDSLVRQLLERGVDVNHGDEDRLTALYLACKRGHEGIAKVLLEHGAKVDHADEYGHTALYIAFWCGSENTVKLLFEHGAKVDKEILHLLRDRMNPGARELLELHFARVDQVGAFGWAALHSACRHDHKSTVELLLERGANVDRVDEKGCTALHLACSYGNESIVQLLLEHDVKVDQADLNGVTALQIACENNRTWIARELLGYGAEADQADNNGDTALHKACRNGHMSTFDSCKVLLQFGAKMDQKMISLCKEYTNPNIVKMLEGYCQDGEGGGEERSRQAQGEGQKEMVEKMVATKK